MGFFDLFMSDEKKIKKHHRRLTNRDAQDEDREASAHWLADNGTPEALLALLSRFDMALDHQLKDQLSSTSIDCVLHLAAVSDYSVDHLVINGEKVKPGPETKFGSENDMTLSLARNYKIVDRIREYSLSPHIQLVAFKLTTNASDAEREAAVLNLLKHSLADVVVHNDLTEVDPDNGKHQASLYKGNRLFKRVATKTELIEALEKEVTTSVEKVVS